MVDLFCSICMGVVTYAENIDVMCLHGNEHVSYQRVLSCVIM